MSQGHSSLPTLTVNRAFMTEFIAAETPCFALGMVEIGEQQCGLLALRPEAEIPADITDGGFNFGHSLYGHATFEVIHFAFEFYGYRTYNVLINPNNPVVQSVLAAMIEGGDYFFFALSDGGSVTAFRAEMEADTLSQLKANRLRLEQSTTTDVQYDLAHVAFATNPEPEGILLNWVCRDHIDSLDLTQDRLDLTPA